IPIRMASSSAIERLCGAEPGSIGPVGLDIRIIADQDAAMMADFVCGANQNDKHLANVNWGRDLPEPEVMDLRKAVDGDPCPTAPESTITIRRGIEVGHIFQLGTKYSESLDANCLDETGRSQPMFMGCYGIGVTRVVAAAIEQNHDENGITWPRAIAPFDVCIVPIGYHKSEDVRRTSDQIASTLAAHDIEVLIDDRNERPGVMFAEMDLLGIPHRLVVGDRGLKNGVLEYRDRRTGESRDLPVAEAASMIAKLC
ncbi:MAG: proline--tRNA ligase, partial [Proteobacteria bacterium]